MHQHHGPPWEHVWGCARPQRCHHTTGRKLSMKTGELIFFSDRITSRKVNDSLAKAELQCKVDPPEGLVLHLHFCPTGVPVHRGPRGTGLRKVLCIPGKWDTQIIYTPSINSISSSWRKIQDRGQIYLLEPSSSEIFLITDKCGRAYIHK